MQRYSPPPGEAWRIGRGPFIFRGVPPLCTGNLDLFNDSGTKVKVRAIPVVGHKDLEASARGLGELQVGAHLSPHQHARALSHFVVDPFTPPGTYEGEIACGDQREPIVVHVFEKLSIGIEPGVVQLRGAGGDVLTSRLIVTNRGNVTQTLRHRAEVFLEERNWIGRSLVYALRDTKEEEGHQAYLDRALRELRATLARPAHVTIQAEGPEIQPGETREVGLEITLPAELFKGRTYFGSTPFMSSKLSFEVECSGASNSTKRRPR